MATPCKKPFLDTCYGFCSRGEGAPQKIVTLETFTGKILNDESGTNTQPLFVKKIAGKCGKGFTYLIKIGPLFYEMYHRRDVSGGKLLPCKYFRKPISCNFQCHIESVSSVPIWCTQNYELPLKTIELQ